ncbi:hypothetical protein I4F81_012653 [Pyropia yezoensis]|uniref:Uncharacterized protein n=1 Tax=Pyropia yezoensis TaxID=2788 RepID=A0ACC3CJS1_PYRYE|nr:hypothetical protein I4F81_012653 [Neopyropia yezoensis]
MHMRVIDGGSSVHANLQHSLDTASLVHFPLLCFVRVCQSLGGGGSTGGRPGGIQGCEWRGEYAFTYLHSWLVVHQVGLQQLWYSFFDAGADRTRTCPLPAFICFASFFSLGRVMLFPWCQRSSVVPSLPSSVRAWLAYTLCPVTRQFAVFALAFQCSCTPLYHHPVPTWLHLLRRVHLCVLHSSSAVSICTSPMCVYMRGSGGSECVLPYCQPRPCACLRGIACCQFYRCVLGGRRRGGDVGVIKQSTLHPEWWFPARKPPRRVRFQHAWETAVKRGALPTRSLSPPANKRANDGGKGILNGGCAVLYCPRGWLLGSTPKAFTQSCRQHEKR